MRSFPACAISTTRQGGAFTHHLTLAAGGHAEIWTWVMLSDRLKFTHFRDQNRVRALVDEHVRGWRDFWATSQVVFDDARLTTFRQAWRPNGSRCRASRDGAVVSLVVHTPRSMKWGFLLPKGIAEAHGMAGSPAGEDRRCVYTERDLAPGQRTWQRAPTAC